MVYLPTEVLRAIVSELKDENFKLASLTTVDRQWQHILESIIWREIWISVDDLDHFRNYFYGRPTRRRSLGVLTLHYYDLFNKAVLNSRENVNTVWKRGDLDSNKSHHRRSAMVTEEEQHHRDTQKRFSAFQNEHLRFLHESKSFLDELHSWEDDLRVTELKLCVEAQSMYELLGPSFQEASVAQAYFSEDTWLCSPDLPQLPSLPTVKTFVLEPSGEIDLWPAIVAFRMANILPNVEVLESLGDDAQRRWTRLRQLLRETLARQLLVLPPTLTTVQLSLHFFGIANQEMQPASFLSASEDYFSKAIRTTSGSLTTLAVSANHLSSNLFWDSEISLSGSWPTLWPNLRTIDIRTGFETSTGEYWMRSAITLPEKIRGTWCDYDETDSEDFTDDQLFDQGLGYWPCRLFRIRPEPKLFNELALNIAHAANCMPKLAYFNLEFTALHRAEDQNGTFENFETYEGWAFYFRSGNEAKFASAFFQDQWHQPGIDGTEISRPRTEWVFQCPYTQVQWEEPAEAKSLWRKKCPDIDFDMVTLNYDDDDTGDETWERRRDGGLICSSSRKFSF